MLALVSAGQNVIVYLIYISFGLFGLYRWIKFKLLLSTMIIFWIV